MNNSLSGGLKEYACSQTICRRQEGNFASKPLTQTDILVFNLVTFVIKILAPSDFLLMHYQAYQPIIMRHLHIIKELSLNGELDCSSCCQILSRVRYSKKSPFKLYLGILGKSIFLFINRPLSPSAVPGIFKF